MSWPFSNVAAPTLDTTPGQAVPTSPTSLSTAAVWLMGVSFDNADTSNMRTVLVTDTAGNVLYQATIPPGDSRSQAWSFRPATGLKWSADGSNVTGQIWGYD